MKPTTIFLIAVSVLLLSLLMTSGDSGQLGSSQNYNTWDRGTTNTTVTINTTSTRALASITKWAELSNQSTGTVYCKLDDLGTTAASSTVTSSTGIMLAPHFATASTTGQLSTVQFGECGPGALNCIPFKGTVNCAASAAVTVSVISK